MFMVINVFVRIFNSNVCESLIFAAVFDSSGYNETRRIKENGPAASTGPEGVSFSPLLLLRGS